VFSVRTPAPTLLLWRAAVLALLAGAGCGGSQRLASDARGAPEPFSVTTPPEVTHLITPEKKPEPVPRLMVFGGREHDIYLGCLSCEPQEPESIFNEFGSYGSAYSPYSIHNVECVYGDATSPVCPANPRALYPPVIRDQTGRFYGYLTVNGDMPQAYRDVFVQRWLERVRGR